MLWVFNNMNLIILLINKVYNLFTCKHLKIYCILKLL